MSKSNKIKEFIRKKPRRRKEITKFIKVTIGDIKKEDYNPDVWIGNYGNNLATFRQNGHLEIINGYYQLTEFGKKSKLGMYQEIPEYIINKLKNNLIDLRQEHSELNYENYMLKIKIKDYKRELKRFREPKFIINITRE